MMRRRGSPNFEDKKADKIDDKRRKDRIQLMYHYSSLSIYRYTINYYHKRSFS